MKFLCGRKVGRIKIIAFLFQKNICVNYCHSSIFVDRNPVINSILVAHFTTMDNIQSISDAVKFSEENILELIRRLRNDLIKDFLDERNLKNYFAENFNHRELSPVKIEFIKKDLKEMLIAPVDITHYDPLITQIRESNSASLTEGNDELFYKDIAKVFKKYNY